MDDYHCHSAQDKEKMIASMKPMWRAKVKDLFGTGNVQGIEISGLIRRLANIYDAIYNMDINGSEITGPRLSILIRLFIDEKIGRTEGLNPTFLSKLQNVSKNTISSLVRGLEDQGLVQRQNDTEDRRIYRLQLTDAGRNLIIEKTPRLVDYMNSMTDDLSSEEKSELIRLLEKLIASVIVHSELKKEKMRNS
jgi:DNA-binding MarR family transcriptional regulator